MDKVAYSVDEAASKASVGRTLLYEAMKSGALGSIKVGRKRLITDEQLRSWLARHEVRVAA